MSNSCGVHDLFWPAEPLSPTAGAGQAGSYAFAESDSFLLRDRGENGNDRILEDPAGIEVRLGETAIANASASQSIEMGEGFEDAFAGDVAEPATEPKRMAGQGKPASPGANKKIDSAESSPESTDSEAKDKGRTTTKKDTGKTAAAKLANRAATLLRIAQNLEKDGKSTAALKNFRQIVKDFPGTPAAKTAAERIKALEKP